MAEIFGDTSSDRTICLRFATLRDSRCLWIWANDADARRVSLDFRPISWQKHAQWLNATLNDQKQCVLIAQFSGETIQPVGVVRCRMVHNESISEISLNLDPSARGKGWGTRILAICCPMFFDFFSVQGLRARIEHGNLASERVFRRAGFSPSGQCHRLSAQRLIVDWERNLI